MGEEFWSLRFEDQTNGLEFGFQPESPNDLIIGADGASHGFAGRGGAWFDRDQVADALEKIALLLSGKAGEAALSSTLNGEISIKLWPINSRGYFALQVILSDATRIELPHAVTIAVPVVYADVEKFARSLDRFRQMSGG